MHGGIQHNPARDLSALVVGASDCAPTDFTLDIGKHSPVDPKAGDVVADNLTDQSRLVFIGRPFAVPFIYQPFHAGRTSRVCQK